MKTIKIKGVKYKVAEMLAIHSSGLVAAFVLMPDGSEKVAVRDFGIWRFWDPDDRIKPLVDFSKIDFDFITLKEKEKL